MAGGNAKLRVLHLTHHFAPCMGGIERVVLELCRELGKRGVESEVVCLDRCNRGSETLKGEETVEGTRVRRLPFLDLKYYKVAPGLLKCAMKSRADVLHLHAIGFFSDFLILTKFLHKKPIVVSPHGGVFHTKKLSLLKRLYFFGWCRWLLRNTKVLAHSKNDFELFSRISKDVTLLPYSIDCKRFKMGKRNKRQGMLFVGRLSKNKQTGKLIETLAFVNKALPKDRFKLTLVGGDWGEKSQLQALAKELGVGRDVVFAGEVSEKRLRELFGSALLFVSASRYEAFGLSAVEAMASGCIPVLNDIDSFRNIVEDGKSGFIVDYSRPEQAAVVLRRILKQGGAGLGKLQKNAVAASRRHCWEKNAKAFEELYRNVVQQSKGAN